MKSSLDRTAILSTDLTEQPAGKYVVMIPDMNVTMSADHIKASREAISVYDSDEALISAFSPQLPWAMIDFSRVNLMTREQQLKRAASNQTAEAALLKEIAKEVEKVLGVDELGVSTERKVEGSGGRGYL